MAETKKRSPKTDAARRKDPELRKIYERVGRRIADLRDQAGLTQEEACAQVFGRPGLQSNWSLWERGKSLPNIATLHRIAEWGGTTLGDLGLYEPEPVMTRAEMIGMRAKLVDMVGMIEAALTDNRAPESRNGRRK